MPTVVAALAWVGLLGRNGILARWGLPLDWSYTLRAVILAHVFFNAPWIALLVAQARRQVPVPELEAALVPGASRWERLRFIEWPVVQWALFSAVTQAFAFCSMSFALVLILGGGPPVETLETALYSRLRLAPRSGRSDRLRGLGAFDHSSTLGRGPDLSESARKGDADGTRGSRQIPRRSELAARVRGLDFLRPLFSTLTGNGWMQLVSGEGAREVWPAARVSAALVFFHRRLSVITAIAAVIALSRIREGLGRALANGISALPGGISVLVLGLGFWEAYGRWVDPFEGSFAAMVALQGALFLISRFACSGRWRGRPEWGCWKPRSCSGHRRFGPFSSVEWPRWRPALSTAFALVAAASMGEVAAVSLFQSEKLIPLPLLISRWSAQYRFDEARAVAGLLLVLSAGILAIVYWVRPLSEVIRDPVI